MAKKRTRFHQLSVLALSPKAARKPNKRWLSQRKAAKILKLALLTADVILRTLDAIEKLKGFSK